MPCTLDSVLAFFRGTILHPLGSPACLGLLVASGLEKAPFTIRTDTLGIQISESLSSRSKFALFCVGFSWLLQVNRIMNRRALNPRPAGEYNWPREVVVITGGSGGIGAELAQKLERLGAVVVVLDVAKLSFTPRSSRVHFYKCNVANFEAVNEIYKKIQGDCGTPTILVANAGIVRGRTVLDATEADIRMTFDVNVLGVMWCLKVFLPAMIAADHGHVLITSSATAFVTVAGAVDYSASKAAVTSIYEGVQTELKNKYGNPRVQLSAIFPATIATKMFEGIEGGGGFLLPLLTPEGVAERMLQVLKKGESKIEMMPASSNANPWMRCFPTWMRVGAQDAGAKSMDHLSISRKGAA